MLKKCFSEHRIFANTEKDILHLVVCVLRKQNDIQKSLSFMWDCLKWKHMKKKIISKNHCISSWLRNNKTNIL